MAEKEPAFLTNLHLNPLPMINVMFSIYLEMDTLLPWFQVQNLKQIFSHKTAAEDGSEVPASSQISQLLWIVGNISAYAETHWQIFSTFDTCRHKFRHKFKRQLERTSVLCISLFKPITSFKNGCRIV